MIFRFQLTLSPGTDLLIGDTSNIMHFLQKNCMHFTLDNVLQFCLSSLWSLLFYVLGSLMVFSGSWKCRDCKLVGISSSISRISRHIFQLQRCPKRNGTGIELWIQSWRFLLCKASHFYFTVRISTNYRNRILVHFADWLFHVLQTLANQWLPNYHISMISSNTLPLGSSFFQHRPFDTLWVPLQYT